jgi:hypothetical protein
MEKIGSTLIEHSFGAYVRYAAGTRCIKRPMTREEEQGDETDI